MTDFETTLETYLEFWRKLDPVNITEIHPLVTDDVRFVDPFNDSRGRDNLEKILRKIFHDCRAVSFIPLDHGWSAQPQNFLPSIGAIAYLRWEYRALPHKSAEWWILNGVSELHFTPEGLLAAHIDHWDSASQIFPKFPILRQLWSFFQRKMRAT